jgi:hypothetical protein
VPRGRVDSPPCPAHLLATNVRTKCLCVASTPGCCRCGIAVAPCCVRACLLCRRAELSPPSLPPCAGPRCFYAMHCYKRRLPPHLIRNCVVSVSGKSSPPHRLCFSVAPSVPSRHTPPLSPCAGPEAPQGPRAAPRPAQVTPSPLLSSGAVDRAGELPLLITCPPSYELVLLTMSGRWLVS